MVPLFFSMEFSKPEFTIFYFTKSHNFKISMNCRADKILRQRGASQRLENIKAHTSITFSELIKYHAEAEAFSYISIESNIFFKSGAIGIFLKSS